MLRITFSASGKKRKPHTPKPEQAELADEVAAMFRTTPVCWPLDWRPLAGATPPVDGGLYALGFPRGIRYDQGASRIIYIGSAENLSRRIAIHFRQSQNDAVWELQTLAPLNVTWWTLPSMGRRWLYTLEGEAICTFERTYGTVPFANLTVSESPHAGHCRDWIAIPPCDVADPLHLDGLTNKVRRRFHPEFGKNITANQWCYGEFVRPSKEEIEEKYRKREHQRTMEQLSTIWCVHTGEWSVKKLAALIQICRTLQTLPQQSTVIRFAAPDRATPRPHTWGEVALVQARLIAETWNPQSRVWVKIRCGKELLGDVRLDPLAFTANDRSDLPQRAKPRAERQVEGNERLETRFRQALDCERGRA